MTTIPTQLFVGTSDDTIAYAEHYVQKIFCPQARVSDCFCTSCRQIKNRQHFGMVWICPENDYTISDIEIIFEKTAFGLDTNESFYFILEHAHTLNLAAANKLLKVLEEPPQGYHFILLTTNEHALLPTILSRCHVVRLQQSTATTTMPALFTFFCDEKKRGLPLEFEQELRKAKLNDSTTTQMVNDMLHYFSQKLIASYTSSEQIEKKYLEAVIVFLKEKLQKPPQSGSSLLFLKNLYLHFPRL
ncbi:hypothetical protein K2X40_02935 [Candidatus Babeliales bacterium]|nr:hypothetical protein [Candidatus Babeliales bacterium]